MDKINWRRLSDNLNAILILEKNKDIIDWRRLSENPNAIHILEKNKDKIDWDTFSCNPGIFEIDYSFLKKRMDIIREELMSVVLHPDRIEQLFYNMREQGDESIDNYI